MIWMSDVFLSCSDGGLVLSLIRGQQAASVEPAEDPAEEADLEVVADREEAREVGNLLGVQSRRRLQVQR